MCYHCDFSTPEAIEEFEAITGEKAEIIEQYFIASKSVVQFATPNTTQLMRAIEVNGDLLLSAITLGYDFLLLSEFSDVEAFHKMFDRGARLLLGEGEPASSAFEAFIATLNTDDLD